MSDYPYHQSLRLQNFTAFQDTAFEFVPGVNVFVGENGTGKTHVMKALYAWQITRHLTSPKDFAKSPQIFPETYGVKNTLDLHRDTTRKSIISGKFDGNEWNFEFLTDGSAIGFISEATIMRPVFIPAIELMAHARNMNGILRDYADFDRTCFDFISLVTAQKLTGGRNDSTPTFDQLQSIVPGEVEWNEAEQKFYLAEKDKRLPFALVAEGVRKVSALQRLIQNGWLKPGTTLFWDEPEVNINPQWMDEVAGAILALARSGVQVFLATHSYVMLREIEVQSRKSDTLRYFALARTEEGITANPADSYLEINPNPIERQYAELYDRSIAKRLKGEAH